MPTDSKYHDEIENFQNVFKQYIDKKIVLYGIGRFTATLVPALKNYKIIGLMDRDPENIGKVMYGIPVMGGEEVKKNADMIIINTSGTYWKIIFKRICNLGIPVFYKNGKRAVTEAFEDSAENLAYWNKSFEDLEKTVSDYEVVSFDLFDTLIMRKTYLPSDVWRIPGKYGESLVPCFYQDRSMAAAHIVDQEPFLDLIYQTLSEMTNISKEQADFLKEIELQTERAVILPRKSMIDFFLRLKTIGKSLYILSDMYLPASFLNDILKQYGIFIEDGHLLVSGEMNINKQNGSLWKYYKEEIVRGRKAIHVGDNEYSDCKAAQKFNIASFHVFSARKLFSVSSVRKVDESVRGFQDSIMTGMICSHLFNDPFVLCLTKGRVKFSDKREFGYCVLGPVITAFLLWLIKMAEADGIQQLLFLARDGYFLIRDFKYLTEMIRPDFGIHSSYIEISRQLAALSAADTEDELQEAACIPYSGTFREYMEDRFQIIVDESVEKHANEYVDTQDPEFKHWLEPYKKEIESCCGLIKREYKSYLQKQNIQSGAAIVDLGYYGSNQYFLNKFLGMKMPGYYINANLSENNIYSAKGVMKACFQDRDDLRAERSRIYKNCLLLESFLTSPFGMIKGIDEEGKFIYDVNKKNQKHFSDKEIMNEGVIEFMQNFVKLTGEKAINCNINFVDSLYGLLLENSLIEENIASCFYNDNAMIHRRESRIFE